MQLSLITPVITDAQASGGELTLAEKTEIWSFFSAVTRDDDSCLIGNILPFEDVIAGKILRASGGGSKDAILYSGAHIQEGGKDGRISCRDSDEGQDATQRILGLLGYESDYTGFLKKIGFIEQSKDGRDLFITPGYEDGGKLSATKHADKINSLLREHDILPMTTTSGPTFAAYKYQILARSLERGCQVGAPLTTPDARVQAEKGQNGHFFIKTVDDTTGVVSNDVVVKASDPGGKPTVGPGMGSTRGWLDLTCKEIAQQLNNANLADAYAKYIRDNLARGSGNSNTGWGGFGSLGASGTGPGAAGGELECDGGGFIFGWVLCGALELLNNVISVLDNIIMNLLTISAKNFDVNTEMGGAYYRAWSSFRNIALGIVVIAALVVIVGSALGYELLDAYTIRKVLPRIVFAIIFISLSWYILSFFVVLINDIGNGVRWLIYQPFAESGMSTRINLSGGANQGWSAMFALGFLGYAAILKGAIATFLFAGAIILATAVLILILRELIVILLVILAPIGIACYILPNTQKGWQLWQNTITTMLLVFPIIAALIAFGRVFSAAAVQQNDSFSNFIAIAAYFIPYFLIPYSFKLAGGAIAGLANIANNSERGVFDRLRNRRQRAMDEGLHNLGQGSHFSNNNVVGRSLNRTSRRVAATAKYGGINVAKWGSRGTAAINRMSNTAASEFFEKNEALQRRVGDTDVMRAVNASNNERQAMAYLREHGYTGNMADAQADIRNMYNSGSSETVRKAAFRALAQDASGFENAAHRDQAIAAMVGGNAADANGLLAMSRSAAARNMRFDLVGSSHGQSWQELNRHLQGEFLPRDGSADEAARIQHALQESSDRIALGGLATNDAMTIARSHTRSVQGISDALGRRIDHLNKQRTEHGGPGLTIEESTELGRLMADQQNVRDAASDYAGSEKKTIVAELHHSTAAARVASEVNMANTPGTVINIHTGTTRPANPAAPDEYEKFSYDDQRSTRRPIDRNRESLLNPPDDD